MADAQQLIAQLDSMNMDIRVKTIEALREMGVNAIEPLLQALDKNTNIQSQHGIIRVLSFLNDDRSISALFKLLTDDADVKIRVAAANALADLQQQSALPIIQQLAQDETDGFMRMSFVKAADKLGQHAWVLEFTEKVLTEPQYNNHDRQAAVQVITHMQDPATADLLLRLLKQRERGVQIHALDALKKFKHQPTIDFLITVLADATGSSLEDRQWRASAAIALGEMGDVRAVEPLKKLLGNRAIAWEADPRDGPARTIGQVASDAINKLQPRKKFFGLFG